MLETNIRIVETGTNLHLKTRVLEFEGSDDSPKTGELAVSFLRRDRSVASIVLGNSLLALTSEPVTIVERNKEGQRMVIRDTGRVRELRFSNPGDRMLMANLLERQLELLVNRSDCWWSLDSLRIWYERESFDAANGIAAWRRYELAAVVIEGEGIGLVVDVGTAFISQDTVADYFVKGANGNRKHEFLRLTSRQQEQKGTLIYDNGKGKLKCYFEEWGNGMTCSTTGTIEARGRKYESLYKYAVAECRRDLKADAPVARVSFGGLGTQRVPAEWLQIRVMNDSVPGRLKQVDKICPADRSRLIEVFWKKLGSHPLGESLPDLVSGFWQPSSQRVLRLRIPALLFGNGHVLAPPETNSINHIRANFRNRERCLAKYGCWYVPQTVLRTIHLAIRRNCGDVTASWLALGIQKRLSMWTQKQINVGLISDDSLDGLKKKLRQVREPGLAVIVFPDNDPATYHDLEYELDEWRIKRITERQLARKAEDLPNVEPADDAAETGSARWETFVDKCALNVLELLECIPYIPASTPSYEARFGIDVGYTRRHFAVSLIVWRRVGEQWQFWADTKVCSKADFKKEQINRKILADVCAELAKQAAQAGIKGINSVLSVRDGKECGDETEAFEDARPEMEGCGFLSHSAEIDDIDFYKNSIKGIRIWERDSDGQVVQAIEGSAVRLSERVVVAQFTGAATLNQGTAEPVIAVSRSGNALSAMEDEFDLGQCNWASPSVAQRLPIELKRTDDELSHRMAQEVRRIR
jgi:hypothetical protein